MFQSLNTNSENNNREMSVLERQRLRLQWPQEQTILYNEQLDNTDVFPGFNSCGGDQGLGELLMGMKPDPDSKTGSSYGPGFQNIPRTLSCPPNVVALEPARSSAATASKKRKKADKTHNYHKVVEAEKCDEKKMKGCSEEESKTTGQNSSSKSTTTTAADTTKGTSESPKPDYIHVRARRGQATDSHSLAERVRREKISERMKFLQDLVPGCNKITGKAGMLDEIINYVQSLQRQVEFLSMKLAVINPRLDFDDDNNNYIVKEMYSPDVQTIVNGMTSSSDMINHIPIQFNGLGQNSSLEMVVNPMDLALRRTISAPQTLLDSTGLNQIQQLVWEDELHNLYGMDYQQGQASPFISQSFTGLLEAAGHVKMEM